MNMQEYFEMELISIRNLAGTEPVKACEIMSELAENDDTRPFLNVEEYGLIDILTTLLTHMAVRDDVLLAVSLTCRKFASIRQLQVKLGSNSQLIDNMAAIIISNKALDVRENFLETFARLSLCKENQLIFFSLEELRKELVLILLDQNSPLCSLACNVLGNLAYTTQVRSWLLSSEENMVQLRQQLVNEVRAEMPESLTCQSNGFWSAEMTKRFRVWTLLSQMAFQPDGAMWLAGCDNIERSISSASTAQVVEPYSGGRVLPVLIRTIRMLPAGTDDSSPVHLAQSMSHKASPRGTFLFNGNSLRQSAWNALANVAGCPSCVPSLLAPENDLLPLVFTSLFEADNAGVEFMTILRMLWGLCVSPEVVMAVVAFEVSSLPLQSHHDGIVDTSSSGQPIIKLRTCIAFFSHTLLSKKKNRGHMWMCRVLVRLAESGIPDVLDSLLEHNIPQIVLRLVQDSGEHVTQWSSAGYVPYCMSFLMNIAGHDKMATSLVQAGALEVMEKILNHHETNRAESLKAMIIVGFLQGREESEGTLLQARPEIVQMILQALETTLRGKHGEGYRFGTFRLHLLLRACLAISVSDCNKIQLGTKWLVELLKEDLLERYAKCLPPVPPPPDSVQRPEGGVDDVLAVELAIETLLQLSFLYEDNLALQTHLMVSEIGLLECISEILDSNVQASKLSALAVRNADFLRSRLIPVPTLYGTVSDPEPTAVGSGSKSHIMLSYCWQDDARPDLVRRLAHQLRETHGYDVWRDEDGSQLLPHMCGSTIERMAEAVELSSVVVVCVSKQYKESANCRMEAKYANRLASMGNIDGIIYVMMQEAYTTHSQPDSCNGWLGIMIGEDLWYPLFDEKYVDSAANGIAKRLGRNSSSCIVQSGGHMIQTKLQSSVILGPTSITSTRSCSSISSNITATGTSMASRSSCSIVSNYDNADGGMNALVISAPLPPVSKSISTHMTSGRTTHVNVERLIEQSADADADKTNGVFGAVSFSRKSEDLMTKPAPLDGHLPTASICPEDASTSVNKKALCCASQDGDMEKADTIFMANVLEMRQQQSADIDIHSLAFELLTDPQNSLISSELFRVLSLYGIRTASDMQFLKSDHIETLGEYLKVVPRNKLLTIYGLYSV